LIDATKFDVILIAYEGNGGWVEQVIKGTHKYLNGNSFNPNRLKKLFGR